jgi:hypothetical protein
MSVTVTNNLTQVTISTAGVSGKSGTSGTSGFSIESASFATTGSNTFIGNQTISGSLNVSASIILPNHVSAPSSPNSGALYFNTTDFHFYGWNGGQWKQLDN